MEMHTFFASAGGDYEAVLRRLPSESMIRRFVGKFRKDPSYASALPEKGYIEAVDWAYQMTIEKIEQISE